MFAKRKISLLVRNKERMCKMQFFDLVPLPPSVYLGRHWCHSRGKISQAFPICFCVLQAIKHWTVGRPGNEATLDAFPDSVQTDMSLTLGVPATVVDPAV